MDIQFEMVKNSERMKWTKGVNKDVLQCKKSTGILSLDNPPLNQNGRKKGYNLKFNLAYKILTYFLLKQVKNFGEISAIKNYMITSMTYTIKLFILEGTTPYGKAGKSFVTELLFWLKQLYFHSDLNSIALKAFMVLPSLILQKLQQHPRVKITAWELSEDFLYGDEAS